MDNKQKEPEYRYGEHTQMALMAQDIRYMREAMVDVKKDISDLKTELEGKYVTTTEFEPIRKIVYGLVAAVLLSVIGAILAIVVKGKS